MSEEPRQVVHSPEQVALHVPVAGPTSRMFAYLVDAVIILLVDVLVLFVVLQVFPHLGRTLLRNLSEAAVGSLERGGMGAEVIGMLIGLFILLQLLVESTYFVFFEMTTGGRSPGKALVRLRVLRDGGLPLDLRASLVRNLLRPVDAFPASSYLAGLVSLVMSDEGKRLGDLAAGTIVARLDRPAPAPLLAEGDAPPAGFRFERAQMARLGATEIALVRETLRRLPALPAAQASPLLERAVEVLRARLDYGAVAPDEREAFLRALLHAARAR